MCIRDRAKEVDKTGGIVLVVYLVLVKGGDFFVIQGIGRSDAGVDNISLVELKLYIAGHGFLCGIHKS